MTTKKPQDHVASVDSLEELEEYFSFEIDGERYVMPTKSKKVMTPGFVRENRRRDETDYFMTLLEALAGANPEVNTRVGLKEDGVRLGKEILKALDEAEWDDHKRIQRELAKHLETFLGE